MVRLLWGLNEVMYKAQCLATGRCLITGLNIPLLYIRCILRESPQRYTVCLWCEFLYVFWNKYLIANSLLYISKHWSISFKVVIFGYSYSLFSAMNKFIISRNNKNNNVFIFDLVLYINSPCSQTSGQATKGIRPLFTPGGLTSMLVLLACENVCSDLLSRVTF